MAIIFEDNFDGDLSYWLQHDNSNGLVTVDTVSNRLRIISNGEGMFNTDDEYFCLYQNYIEGDIDVRVEIVSMSPDSGSLDALCKAGIMIRNDISDSGVTGGAGGSRGYTVLAMTDPIITDKVIWQADGDGEPEEGFLNINVGGSASRQDVTFPLPVWLRLTREFIGGSNKFTAFFSDDGVSWTEYTDTNTGYAIEHEILSANAVQEIGLFVGANHSTGLRADVRFDNFSIRDLEGSSSSSSQSSSSKSSSSSSQSSSSSSQSSSSSSSSQSSSSSSLSSSSSSHSSSSSSQRSSSSQSSSSSSSQSSSSSSQSSSSSSMSSSSIGTSSSSSSQSSSSSSTSSSSSQSSSSSNSTVAPTGNISFSYELHEFDEALTPYGTIETGSPSRSNIVITDFSEGDHFRTAEGDSLILELEDRIVTLILDESGSMTWNDANGDRHTYLRRLLTKLRDTYPGDMTANLIGFGGTLVTSQLLVTKAATDFLASGEGQDVNQLLQDTFQDSVYDFAGVRVVRRTDRLPTHPADGIIVGEGIFDAVKDEGLTEGQRYYYGVWTFNKDLHFSEGRFISGVPFDRVLPRGVNFATGVPRILPGVDRDDNTQVIYNFVERSGTTVFDSSGEGNHGVLGAEVIDENFWVGDAASGSGDNTGLNKPVGVRFDGEFDILEADVGDGIAMEAAVRSLTINFWVYRYANSADVWVIGTSQDETTSSIGWSILINSAGKVSIKRDSIGNSTLPWSGGLNFVPLETWTMVTVVTLANGIDQRLYINGASDELDITLGGIDTTGREKLYIGAFPTDSAVTWTGGDFFGSLAQISIHNTNRSATYISDLYTTELLISDQPLQNASIAPPDNTYREVLLSWNIGEDFDFEGGQVQIVRKYRAVPGHENDGDIVVIQSASEGQFFYLDTFDFVNNADYYYAVYTFNSIGNPCDRSEARILSVHIPASLNTGLDPELESPSGVTVLNGNRKAMLQWKNPSDSRWRGTKIFFGTETYPTISIAAQGELEVSDGFEIYDTQDIDIEFFVHRKIDIDRDGIPIPLTNGTFHFYTILAYDGLGQLSDAEFIVATPSSALATIMPPADTEDLHLTLVNPETLSVQWTNPLVRSDELKLFFGESALVFVSIRDIFGGGLNDIVNIQLQVCTDITNRELSTKEKALGTLGPGDALDPCTTTAVLINGGCKKGARFDENCNSGVEAAETVLSFSTVESGLIKGILTHTPDATILTRRERYDMSIRARYVVEDEKSNRTLFEFNTEPAKVTFQHPLDMSLVNKQKKHISTQCGSGSTIRGETLCTCDGGTGSGSTCNSVEVNGSHINATQPYLVRVELQYKGESLPSGTPVTVQLFRHTDDDILSARSSRVTMREGIYNTTAVQEPLLNASGNPTGDVVGKSIVDVEIPAPSLPDTVDLYVSINYLGFFVDGIHTITFLGSLFIQVEVDQPLPNGIDTSEQFATVWTIDPDDPENFESTVPVPDGTLVKWELVQLRHGKDRPFYSVEPINELISGIYSTTTNGVARNVFFGPIANVESHTEIACNALCCLGEEYAIKASVILAEETATDAMYAAYGCQEETEILLDQRFFMNAAIGQPGSAPNYITWGDGDHLLKFQIAKEPALVTDAQIPGATCFRKCTSGQLYSFPDNHIVQITAPGEILWNVVFANAGTANTSSDDAITGDDLVSFESATIPEDQDNATAAIPITGDVTDFYIRLNKFVGEDGSPQPIDCGSGGAGGIGGGSDSLLSCEWRNVCDCTGDGDDVCSACCGFCSNTRGITWSGMNSVRGTSALISGNIAVNVTGGGGYEQGKPPMLAGWKEPLSVNIIEARLNGERMDAQELVVNGISQHTVVVEIKFANQPVPAGTPIELRVDGPHSNIVTLSNCVDSPPGCSPGSSGIIYADLINDPFINPSGEKRSLAYFSINPLPNIAFNAKIHVTCRYDKLGTVEREMTKCVEVNNTINVDTPDTEVPPIDVVVPPTTVASNEAIVYDTVSDTYSTVVGGNLNRIAHFAIGDDIGTTANVYLFGGYTDHDLNGATQITATAEKYDVAGQAWSFIADMPTARAAGMTVMAGDEIYCIGGLELDPITASYVVSRKIESFNKTTGSWNPALDLMPEDGVAFGDAQFDGDDNIYVLCGVNSVENNNQPGVLNDRILRYTISSGAWVAIRPLDMPLYQRISPFGFYRDNPLPIITVADNIVADATSDAEYSSLGGWETTEASLEVGNVLGATADVFLRFPIDLPANAIIVSASISAEAFSGSADAVLSDVFLLNSDDIPVFIDAIDQHATATTGAGIRWDMTSDFTATSTVYTSPDISPIVQSYIRRSGYSAGNYIGIKLDGTPTVGALVKNIVSADDTFTGDPTLNITYKINDPDLQVGYIYSGSFPKTQAQINSESNSKLDQSLNDFRSFILTSPYYLSLTESEQNSFITAEEERIAESIIVPPYIYPATGFKYSMGSEHIDSTSDLVMNIADKVDDEWTVLPLVRDRGQAVYVAGQDAVYFMGGSNQNQSTTLNRVESIDLANEDNVYSHLTAFSRGRSLFQAVPIQDDIYLSGGLTSGHKAGYVNIELLQAPTLIQAQGAQSSGIVVILRDDAGEVLNQDIRCIVRGRLRVPEIDSIVTSFLAERAADRALGGDGSGNAPDTPNAGDEIDFAQLIEAQNKITDPHSDEFQFSAAKKLGEQVFLFPVLYSSQEITISSGIGGVTLLPRSEDPFANFQRLSQFINETLRGTPPDLNERFEGDLTRDELSSLGDALSTVTLPPVVLDSNTVRNLYDVETVITIIDDFFFGQTVSDFDLNIQEEINRKIEDILTPPAEPDTNNTDPVDPGSIQFGGIPVSDSDCLLLQHVAAQEIPLANQPPPPPSGNRNQNPSGIGGANQTGQCLFCSALLPLQPSIQLQLPTSVATFYNSNDWVPQIRKRITNGGTLDAVLRELDIIDHETPFGASPLYDAMKEASIVTTGEIFESKNKVFYIVSDNAENFSITTRDEAIDEVNAVDGDGNSPIVYTVFSTSFPQSLAAQLQRTEVGDIEKIVGATGGQASTLISSGFLDQILNLTINGATGGLGWGRYTRTLDLGELSAITDVATVFVLPANTQGFLRFRYAPDQFNFTDWTERFEGSQTVDFVDFFARLLQFEIVLTTGFTSETTEEYDSTPTGIPKLASITWGTSGEKEDFIFLNAEEVLTNAQQVAASFNGTIPPSSLAEIGVASSNSHDWRDFQSAARPAMGEFGKTFLLERTEDPFSLVPIEPLVTRDGLLYTTTYGAWDPSSTTSLFRVVDGVDVPVASGFRTHPRQGQIYFDERQSPVSVFKLAIVNSGSMRVGLRLRNRLHTDNISIQGVGFIYSTNDEKAVELSQVAPRAINVFISPTSPDSNDTITALYSYVDLNGDLESGTIIKWFKNGIQLLEINNQTSFSNSNLAANHRIEPNDKIYFSVTPSDGRDFGTTEFSPTAIIVPLPPSAQSFRVIALRNGTTNDRFDTGSIFRVEYEFEIDDEGQNSAESGTLIRWFLNGFLFKKGTFSEADTFDDNNPDPREIVLNETGREPDTVGLPAHSIGNEIIVEVTPKTPLVTGDATVSNPFSVVNSISIISNVVISPSEPTSISTLELTYAADDPDIDDPGTTQTDQREIKWLFSIDGGISFSEWEVRRGETTIPFIDLVVGQQWKAEVTGFDGLDLGNTVTSSTVSISSP